MGGRLRVSRKMNHGRVRSIAGLEIMEEKSKFMAREPASSCLHPQLLDCGNHLK
jgi:hypothetical protein